MIAVKSDLDKIIHDLNQLDEKTIQKALGAGLTAAAKPVKASVKLYTPIESGILRKAIGQRVITKGEKRRLGLDSDARALSVGIIRAKAFEKLKKIEKKITLFGLVGILDGGAKPHVIKPKKKGFLGVGGGYLRLHGGKFVKSVNHPGVKGSGFLQRAFDAADSPADNLFFKGLKKYMDKHAA